MKFLVTGGAGFIGSNLSEALIRKGYAVRILDNFSTGKRGNIASLSKAEILEGDIRSIDACRRAVAGVDFVLHHAAFASVPASVADPVLCNDTNVNGTLNLLLASRDAGVKRLVLASSSSVYGDEPEPIMKTETLRANPISPYALSKFIGEEYCRFFSQVFGLRCICLRYFNVFGKRQDPNSQYAAVIPRFLEALIQKRPPTIYGDGEQTRDFIFVEDVIEANLLACLGPESNAGSVFNIASGVPTSVLQLLSEVKMIFGSKIEPIFDAPRPGDVKHSRAEIGLARSKLKFEPRANIREGLEKTARWYKGRC